MTLSIAGWIADVRFGRYRVIKLSMWIMWAALMLATVSSVLMKTVDSYTSEIHRYVNGVLWITIAIGFGGFLANVIQFGMDQLHDSSSEEMTSFIVWCVWTYYSSNLMMSKSKKLRPGPKPGKVAATEQDAICDGCCSSINDNEHETIQCEGSCQKWYHRLCAGVSKYHYDKLADSPNPFICWLCSDNLQKAVIHELQQELATLTLLLPNRCKFTTILYGPYLG